MGDFTVSVISGGGYLGIVLLMAIESACLPLPSEIIMPFAGYLVSTGRFDLTLVATAGAAGCNLGSTVAYGLGWYGGRPMVRRYGRYVFMSERELDIVERFFVRWGNWAVLLGRLLPTVRTFIGLPAGIARMPMVPFQVYSFIGSWPWCWVLAFVGMKLGEHWNSDPRLRAALHKLDLVIVLAVLAAVLLYAWHVVGRRRTR